MAKFDFSKRDGFGSQIGVIAAAAGSAVGLGNIWRFPYITGENGGAAFLLVYFIFVLSIGIPVMLSEFVIGRNTQRNPFGAFRSLAPRRPWYLVGIMGIAAAFMILAFYSTVAGWTLEYIAKSLSNSFAGRSGNELDVLFFDFQNHRFMPVLWQLVFMFLTAFIVFRGIHGGIEKYTKILMPLLFVLIIIICIKSISLPGASKGLMFFFYPDFSKINAETILVALGQAFFSLSIGMGTLITYGSYIKKKENLTNIAFAVSIADILIALLAGVVIFPAVFAFGIEPEAGPSLVFITLPNIFQSMVGGYYWSLIFFVLLAIAALTSTISVLEVVVAFFSEELSISRKLATLISASAISVLGIFCTLSLREGSSAILWGKNMFSHLEYISANVLLPLGGLMIVLFVGWFMGKQKVKHELSSGNIFASPLFGIFLFIIRFIAPVAIAIVFLYSLGLIK